MDYLLAKYVNLLSGQLRNFKKKGPDFWNCSCPICGDSQKNKRKARGYIFGTRFYCHNCGDNRTIQKLIEFVDPNLYGEYLKERYIELHKEEASTPKPQRFQLGEFTLPAVSQLPDSDPIRRYLKEREIPFEHYHRLFKCDRFMHFCNSVIPGKFPDDALRYDETRLFIPFYNENKEVFAFAGRSLDRKATHKYVQIMLDDQPKIYGLDAINENYAIYVIEGMLDTFFIDNAVAVAGASLLSIRNAPRFKNKDLIFIPDKNVRNLEVMHQVDRLIAAGEKVCLLPLTIKGKDPNEIFLANFHNLGYKKRRERLMKIITENTFQGLELELNYASWRQIKG